MIDICCPKCERCFIHDDEEEVMCPCCDHEFLLESKHDYCKDCGGSREGLYQDQKCIKCNGRGTK
jgi:uncharacterized Zn ribbon protein